MWPCSYRGVRDSPRGTDRHGQRRRKGLGCPRSEEGYAENQPGAPGGVLVAEGDAGAVRVWCTQSQKAELLLGARNSQGRGMTGSSSDLQPFPFHGHFQEIPAFSLGEGWVLEQLPGCRQQPQGSPGWAPPGITTFPAGPQTTNPSHPAAGGEIE